MSTDPNDEREITLDELAVRIQLEYYEAESGYTKFVDAAVRCGKLLLKAKEQVPYGSWLRWVSEHFPASERTAENYMKLAQVDDPQLLAGLKMGEALATVSVPREPQPSIHVARGPETHSVFVRTTDYKEPEIQSVIVQLAREPRPELIRAVVRVVEEPRPEMLRSFGSAVEEPRPRSSGFARTFDTEQLVATYLAGLIAIEPRTARRYISRDERHALRAWLDQVDRDGGH